MQGNMGNICDLMNGPAVCLFSLLTHSIALLAVAHQRVCLLAYIENVLVIFSVRNPNIRNNKGGTGGINSLYFYYVTIILIFTVVCIMFCLFRLTGI